MLLNGVVQHSLVGVQIIGTYPVNRGRDRRRIRRRGVGPMRHRRGNPAAPGCGVIPGRLRAHGQLQLLQNKMRAYRRGSSLGSQDERLRFRRFSIGNGWAKVDLLTHVYCIKRTPLNMNTYHEHVVVADVHIILMQRRGFGLSCGYNDTFLFAY